MSKKTFGQLLSKYIDEKGIKQNFIARNIGMSNSAIVLFKNDGRLPNFEKFKMIMELFNLNKTEKKEFIKSYVYSCISREGKKAMEYLNE